MHPLADQQVLLLGLGQSGLAMARWCARAGAQVIVADTRDEPPQLDALRRELPTARFVAGPFTGSLLDDARIRAVFKSPGLMPDTVAPVLAAARAKGLWWGGELELFSQALAQLRESQGYAPEVLAITGTNGKTTVTALTGQLVERAG
ncbi:MAG: UDP-N-acetylmuramoyl-L-alanine--D-glutamate ligase, partial [Burkholderiaceae bacterium]